MIVRFVTDKDGMITDYIFEDSELMQSSMQHAAAQKEMIVRFVTDKDGMITDYIFEDSELMQSDFFDSIDDYIEHFGVKGMRWGVRKDLYEGRTKYGDAARTLTDQELAARVKRLEMEKKYNELRRPTLARGRTKIKRALIKMTGETVNTLAKESLMREARKALGKKMTQTAARTAARSATTIINPGITSFT